ncbi:hypothetical protein BU17DRAFT_62721 [Hysterangium stoloniferum]|nr:hypothetical protein BU17DRAFT_62721 [Hysterangium stoloniferum]
MSIVYMGGVVLPTIVLTSNVVAASMVIFYDYVLTFNDEVELIWKQKLSWVSVMFYITRYLTILIRFAHIVFCSNVFGVIPLKPSGCILWQWFQVMTGQILFWVVELLLILRVFAYYGRKKAVLVGLLLLLVANCVAIAAMVATSLTSVQFVPNTDPAIHSGACVGYSIPRRFSSLWRVIMDVDVVARSYQWNESNRNNGTHLILNLRKEANRDYTQTAFAEASAFVEFKSNTVMEISQTTGSIDGSQAI